MLPRERVLAALHHQEADRVPTGENAVDYQLVQEILGHPTLYNSRWVELQALWDGRRDEIAHDYGAHLVELTRALELDYVRVPNVPPIGEYHRPQMTGPYSWIDDDGYEVHYHPDSGNIAMRATKPEMTIADLPDPDAPFEIDPSRLDAVRSVVAELKATHFIVGRCPMDGTFPWQSVGSMEDFLVRMIIEPEFVRRAIQVYVNRSIAWIEAMLDAGCDAVMTLDDYSDNKGPIMGPARFRDFMLPGLARQVEAAHAKGGVFIKHTDGNTWSLLDMFVDVGVDAWHGIQPSIGMDLRLLKERYAGKLCFFGGVNCETLVDGTPAEVRREALYALKYAAPGGGLVLTSGNVVQPGSQLANYYASRETTRRWGAYPIAIPAAEIE